MLVENNVWRPEHQYDAAQLWGGTQVIVGDRIVHLVRQGDTDEPLRLFVTRRTTGYPANVFFVRNVEGSSVQAQRLVDPAYLESAVSHLVAIAVSAWDASGFIWWTPAKERNHSGRDDDGRSR